MSSASTSKITTKLDDGTEKQFFMKTGSGKEASIMFEGMQFESTLRNLELKYVQASTHRLVPSTTPSLPSALNHSVMGLLPIHPRNTFW